MPPQTPCEFVEDPLAWWAFGLHDRADSWLGHGYFWRSMPQPDDAAEEQRPCLENAAGNAMNDFDVLEDRFCRLRRASVLCADYALLRRHFPQLQGEGEDGIDRWLLENAAWLSQGQVERLRPGGDHSELLGIGDVSDAVDEASARTAVRIRSGGRAATFLVGDHYSIGEDGALHAQMLEVKGLGTHALADISSSRSELHE